VKTYPQWESTRRCLLYLSDVVIGGEDHFVKSWGRDLYSLFEGEGHHGSLNGAEKINIYISCMYVYSMYVCVCVCVCVYLDLFHSRPLEAQIEAVVC